MKAKLETLFKPLPPYLEQTDLDLDQADHLGHVCNISKLVPSTFHEFPLELVILRPPGYQNETGISP